MNPVKKNMVGNAVKQQKKNLTKQEIISVNKRICVEIRNFVVSEDTTIEFVKDNLINWMERLIDTCR